MTTQAVSEFAISQNNDEDSRENTLTQETVL